MMIFTAGLERIFNVVLEDLLKRFVYFSEEKYDYGCKSYNRSVGGTLINLSEIIAGILY